MEAFRTFWRFGHSGIAGSTIAAVEPDPGNSQMRSQNLCGSAGGSKRWRKVPPLKEVAKMTGGLAGSTLKKSFGFSYNWWLQAQNRSQTTATLPGASLLLSLWLKFRRFLQSNAAGSSAAAAELAAQAVGQTALATDWPFPDSESSLSPALSSSESEAAWEESGPEPEPEPGA